ncbi:TetR family transcriptional regulator [Camelimonas fluminis]|uniref:TetR/AcrR family transcriptional regulator n=1 Tax=Camelimonas fluminis TaxID=1576911 RepID=A0ABV7UFE4_9HYPH|nr:TetR/AcrR family transcriptional regulator [Camelimonas fluminis]GHE70615.1 TetR family transcriptional regulator [Camelimonas fluminis]
MRISKKKAEANKAEVVAQASRLFREQGLDGPSVAELMRAAGMTHGGFYNHFSSKTDLQACALAHNFDLAVARLARIGAGPDAAARRTALEDYIAHYLSPKARDASGASCPMVAFGADVSREDAEVRRAYADGLERYLTDLAHAFIGRSDQASDGDGLRQARAQAIALLATLVGGLSLARSVAGINPALSDELLASARSQALALASALAPA